MNDLRFLEKKFSSPIFNEAAWDTPPYLVLILPPHSAAVLLAPRGERIKPQAEANAPTGRKNKAKGVSPGSKVVNRPAL